MSHRTDKGGDDDGVDRLWDIVAKAIRPAVDQCRLLDTRRVEKKVREHFRKGLRGLAFGRKPWEALVNDYANDVFASLFSALFEEEWLMQVDFLLVLDMGIREGFPQDILQNVSEQAYESIVLDAHDRAYEEQRFVQIGREKVWNTVQGDKTRKRVHGALQQAWKDARDAAASLAGERSASGHVGDRWKFLRILIDRFMAILVKEMGELSWNLPLDVALALFQALLAGRALPMRATFQGVLDKPAPMEDTPDDQRLLARTVAEAWRTHASHQDRKAADRKGADGRGSWYHESAKRPRRAYPKA